MGQFLPEPSKTVQVITQGNLGVSTLLGDQANGSVPATLLNGPQHPQFMVTLRRWDQAPVHHHARYIHCDHIRLDALPDSGKIRDVSVAMTEVIDHPDAAHPFLS